MDSGGPFGQVRHHLLLYLRGLHHHGLKLCLRHREVELVGGLDVGHLFEHTHQLREVEELGKPCPGAVACPLRGQLYGRGGLAKGGGPLVEMGQPLLPERTMLQVAHHGVKLCHTVRHRCPRGKDRTLPASQFIHILALHEHIRGLLRLGGGKPRHIPHFRVEEQIFERMGLVHKEPVHTKLLKGYHIVLALCCLQFLHPGL